MPDFSIRSDSVNVEQIMEQIRARIREKRGVDYTEDQIRELAAVKLETFLDPRSIRSDLLERFRPAPRPDRPNYAFEDDTLFETHRGLIRFMRRLLNPLLKLFFNPNPLIQALHIQSRLNTLNAEREATFDQLHVELVELVHNLVLETTRLGIEVKNVKMRVESLGSRLEFNERRARALESVVVYRPSGDREDPTGPAARPAQPVAPPARNSSGSWQARSQQGSQGSRGSQSSRGSQGSSGSRNSEGSQVSPVAQPLPADSEQAASTAPEQTAAVLPGQDPPAPVAAAQAADGPGQRSRRRRRRRGRRGGASATTIMGQPEGTALPMGSEPHAFPDSGDPDGGTEAHESGALEGEPGDGEPDGQ